MEEEADEPRAVDLHEIDAVIVMTAEFLVELFGEGVGDHDPMIRPGRHDVVVVIRVERLAVQRGANSREHLADELRPPAEISAFGF